MTTKEQYQKVGGCVYFFTNPLCLFYSVQRDFTFLYPPWSYTSFGKAEQIPFSFYRRRKSGSGRLSDLLSVAQLRNAGAGPRAQVFGFLVWCSVRHSVLPKCLMSKNGEAYREIMFVVYVFWHLNRYPLI